MVNLTKNKKKSTLAALEILVALIIIVVGVLIATDSVNKLQDGVEDDQDRQLRNAVNSVDYNLSYMIRRFDLLLGNYVNSEMFGNDIDEWIANGNENKIKKDIKASAIATMRQFETIILESKDGKQFHSNQDKGYAIRGLIKENIYRCTDGTGEEYLAIKYELKNDITCYGLMNVEQLTNITLQRGNITDKTVLLMEASTGTLFYTKKGKANTCLSGYYSEAGKSNAKAAAILAKPESKANAAKTYEVKSKDGETITIRLKTLPAEKTKNKIFAISASKDYHIIDKLVSSTVRRLIISFVVVALGIILIMAILLLLTRERREADIELENLKEKNRQMEELNEKTQELAHHQRLETIGTMTSGIAHEFNNLLTPIMGYSVMTLEKLPQDDELIYDDILEIYNASVKAKTIVSRLSELSRKNTQLVFKELNPDDLVNKVIHVTAPMLPKNVDIIRELSCKNNSINGNEVQLSQLLINLLINAFHALKEKGGEVTIGTRDEGEYIVFSVSDNGEGISEEIKEKIFDPFFTTKEAGAGTGLGLAIAMQAAEDHGGEIKLESKSGSGAEFKVYIPKAK